ncbi:endolytic transglycosylase MltG [Methylotenera sp.]|uniref:endolytic transglycosylase MltG n=1 Tax=Methylotenera sp. TaxID=2051956 RepID=UPI00271CBD22|nr:endolytic transglycosylase MltG [Methylotenera sp.]MDO9204687.1 endolytic transglycosylase MltG [Methylotenera sp.]MDP2071544.1 endolytic transglycosylase MltG [Methylotenera sp.]MDP3004933.1 endolytic transglycosylase MltG [Methylotenera sp.]MDP3307115.1 endolytic transglycosylase MltG [Methylotenera sp.]
MIKIIKKWFLLTLIAICILGALLAYYAASPLRLQPNSQEIVIQPNSGLKSIANQLVEQGVLTEPWRFIIIAKLLNKEKNLQAGNYTLNRNVTPYQLLLSLNHGKATQGSATFIEGRTFQQMRDRIKKNDAIKQTITVLSEPEILKLMGSEYSIAEGLFFPDTYYFDRNTADTVILKRSYDAMQSKLKVAWERREAGLPYKNSYEALIMASIVEKETGKASERPMIAGVFINRLRIGMRLQTDPTVIYGMGAQYNGNIRKKDLLTDTPYNTYTRNGLPPSPIAMPGMAAIEAALHPEKTKALYFVGKGDGSHAFSNNLEDHNRAVVKYQLKK